jgi:hypothetical protein
VLSKGDKRMHRRKIIIGLFVITTALILSLPMYANSQITHSGTIIFDNSVGFFGIEDDSSVGLSTLRWELEFEGFEVTDTLEMQEKADTITSRLLNRTDVLIIMNPTRYLDWEETDLIRDFVEAGGKLLLISDTPESSAKMNAFSRRFGVKFLDYYLGDEIEIDSNISELLFISPVPLALEEEPEVSLQTNFTEAKEWHSVWELPGGEIEGGNFTVFAGIRYGNGSIAFLGDKDILLNEYIMKGDNLDFIMSIFTWFEHEKPDDAIVYSSDKLDFYVTKGKASILGLRMENRGDVNQSLKFVLPPYLDDIVSVDPERIKIHPEEIVIVRIRANWSDDYSYIGDFIVVERDFDYYKTNDYIKLEVNWSEQI